MCEMIVDTENFDIEDCVEMIVDHIVKSTRADDHAVVKAARA